MVLLHGKIVFVRKLLFFFNLFFITLFISGCSLPGQKSVPSALQITAIPKATVYLDNKELGKTPYYDEKIPAGEHSIRLSADSANFISWQQQVKFTPRILTVINRILGYTQRQIKVKTQTGYRLIINVQLAQILTQETIPPASNSATISAQNTVATSTSTPNRPRVKILDTDTGWLRVRSTPSISASEVTKVYPGEFYSYLDQESGWVKIKLDKDKEGWVSGQYVEKQL
ncbi:SH3 domain-containing protein [Candidatus Gottesmanbacteria bacterium]|nr:SH3 domain-containing protein [Candidatus Gottesmanbacteria bacterium]